MDSFAGSDHGGKYGVAGVLTFERPANGRAALQLVALAKFQTSLTSIAALLSQAYPFSFHF